MNRFTVEWSETAEDQLADSWLRASDPQAVVKAQAAIDAVLAQDPLGQGIHISEGLYKLTVSRLTAFYSVDQLNRTVEVDRISYTP